MAGVMARDELSESCFMRCDHDDGGIVLAKFSGGLTARMCMNKENIISLHSS